MARQILFLAIFWGLGIGLASFRPDIAQPVWIGIGGLSFLISLILFRFEPRIALLFAAVGMLGFGGFRYLSAQPVIDETHIAFYLDQRGVVLTGQIVDEPDIRDRQVNLRLRVEEITLRDGTQTDVSGDILLQTPRFPVLEYGTRVTVRGDLETPFESQEFSYKDYLSRQGIYGVFRWPQFEEVIPNQGNPFYQGLYRVKQQAEQVIIQLVPAPESGLLSGILLGIDHTLPPDIEDDFQKTGITHIVVISGFNISILASIFLALATPFFGRRQAAIVAIMGISLYTLLVGADAAVVRAAIMGGLYVIGERFLGQRNDTVGVLFAAGFIMTLLNPNTLFDVGFQLSFTATLSILFYADRITLWARQQLAKILHSDTIEAAIGFLSEALIVTIAAQILTLPLMMYYFQQVSLVSLLANLFILPAQPGIMLWGGLSLFLGSAVLPIGQPFAWIAYLFLWYTIQMARLFASIPFASVPVSFTLYSLIIVYLFIGILTWYSFQEQEERQAIFAQVSQNFTQRLAIGLSLMALILGWRWINSQPDGLLHIVYFDVGQGDATFIQTPSGRQILLDGGYYPTRLNRHLGQHMPFGDREIDVVIATHPDADHITGLPGVFDRYSVNQLIVAYTGEEAESDTYDAMLASAEAQSTPLYRVTAGETLVIEDGVRFEFVHPGAELLEGSRNDNSVSFRLTYGELTLLFTGDAEVAGERAILQSELPLESYIFKAGHHGANNASTVDLLQEVRPKIVIVSAGVDNRFGHPHPEMLARAAAIGASVLRTDELGTIKLSTDGEQMWWEAQR
ncbi:MAG: DNA internalization-related competence protein ComEC/Rec2 [Chloroflexota bacterium]